MIAPTCSMASPSAFIATVHWPVGVFAIASAMPPNCVSSSFRMIALGAGDVAHLDHLLDVGLLDVA